MSDQPDPRDTQIAALAALQLPLPESTLAQLAQDLRALRASAAPTITAPHTERDVNIATQQTVNSTEGAVSNDGRIDGVAVGINLGTIIYGRRPEEDERRRLVWYLDRLANKLYRLPLCGLEERLDRVRVWRCCPSKPPLPLRDRASYSTGRFAAPQRSSASKRSR